MPSIGDTLNGRYRLDRSLARGGFARVYVATDLLLARSVAIKVLDDALITAHDERDFLARFAQEAALVAQLDHPNILGVHDYGEADGTAFLVMPFVDGGSLDSLLRREAREHGSAHMDPPRALSYLRQAAMALDYAHRRGVVHRDVKPANMLLRAEDDRLFLADFGIAKVLSAAGTHSLTGATGTVAYMAPEQFRGQVGPATDIYALGCVAFQLLTGKPPFVGDTQQVMWAHAFGTVPVLAEHGGGHLPPILQPVLERALAKDSAARFPTAVEFVHALDATLTIATPKPDPPPPIQATSPSWAMPTTPVVAPHGHTPARTPVPPHRPDAVTVSAPSPPASAGTSRRRALAALAGLLLLPLGGVAAIRARSAPSATPTPLPTGVALLTATTAIPSAGAVRPSATPTGGAAVAIASPTATPTALPSATATAPSLAPASTATASPVRTSAILSGHSSWLTSATWSPDGRILASSAADRTVRLWSSEGAALGELTGHTGTVDAIAWSPDGRTLASSAADRSARLWTAEGVPLRELTGHSGRVRGVAWSPDGRTLASASDDKSVRLWSPEGQLLANLAGHNGTVWAIAWSPDGQTLASASEDRNIALWSPTGNLLAVLTGHTDGVRALAWSPDGRILASASADMTVRLWATDGTHRHTLSGHTGLVCAVSWSPDGGRLASAAWDATARLWAADGSLLKELRGHTGDVNGVAWSPDGRILATVPWDGALRLWTPDGTIIQYLTGHSFAIIAAVWSPDGNVLASASWDKTLRLWR
jgi:eukaryotic-like serine/threonine-protein kinase